jgi:hypothetical protein
MTYTNRVNETNRFFRTAFQDWPFTTWTVIGLLLIAVVSGLLWPGVGVVLAWIAGILLVVGALIYLIVRICIEFSDNLY